MYLPIVAFVLALLFPPLSLAADQAQTPAPKAACCQMQSDHAGHGGGAGCCAKKDGEAACESCKECQHCKDGKCEECCKDGACKDGCCKDGCCNAEQRTAGSNAACCKKDAPKQ